MIYITSPEWERRQGASSAVLPRIFRIHRFKAFNSAERLPAVFGMPQEAYVRLRQDFIRRPARLLYDEAGFDNSIVYGSGGI